MLVREIAIDYAEATWKQIVQKISTKITVDVQREITAMAQAYKSSVIGISGKNSGPYGRISFAAEKAEGTEGRASFTPGGHWAARSASYLKRKRREVGHDRWFEHDGLLKSTMGKSDTWIKAFGPIRVSVIKRSGVEAQDAGTKRLKTGISNQGLSVRIGVATVRVDVFGNLTPAMLPALRSGNIEDVAPDGRTTGLIGRFPRDIALGLGAGRQVPYRHTIEPFLGFLMTRSMPNAVLRRIQVGLDEDIRPSIA